MEKPQADECSHHCLIYTHRLFQILLPDSNPSAFLQIEEGCLLAQEDLQDTQQQRKCYNRQNHFTEGGSPAPANT